MIENARHTADFSLERDSILNWQELADMISALLKIPVSLTIRHDPPRGEIIKSGNNKDNPYIVREKGFDNKKKKFNKGMSSYIGYPIMWPDGTLFGTINIMDTRVNNFNRNEKNLLKHFKKIIESQLKLINKYLELMHYTEDLESIALRRGNRSNDIVISCSYCKKIRFDDNSWRKTEEFINSTLNIRISHGICPQCTKELFRDHA